VDQTGGFLSLQKMIWQYLLAWWVYPFEEEWSALGLDVDVNKSLLLPSPALSTAGNRKRASGRGASASVLRANISRLIGILHQQYRASESDTDTTRLANPPLAYLSYQGGSRPLRPNAVSSNPISVRHARSQCRPP